MAIEPRRSAGSTRIPVGFWLLVLERADAPKQADLTRVARLLGCSAAARTRPSAEASTFGYFRALCRLPAFEAELSLSIVKYITRFP